MLFFENIVILTELMLFFRTGADKVVKGKVTLPVYLNATRSHLLLTRAGLWHRRRRVRQGPQLLREGNGYYLFRFFDKCDHYQLQLCLVDIYMMFCLVFKNACLQFFWLQYWQNSICKKWIVQYTRRIFVNILLFIIFDILCMTQKMFNV